MTPQEIEDQAKAAGISPGEFVKRMSETQEKVAEDIAPVEPSQPVVRMQHLIVTLSDGRRGVFMGPELIKESEFKLGIVPRPIAIDFDPPRAVAVPTPREEVPTNADTKVDDKPTTGLV